MFPFFLLAASAMAALRTDPAGAREALLPAEEPPPSPRAIVDDFLASGANPRRDRGHRGLPGIGRRSQAQRRRAARRTNRPVTRAH